MSHEPSLFDRKALDQHRQRADPAKLFLQRAAMDEVQDRVSLVNRHFTAQRIVTGFTTLWQQAFPDATVLTDGPVLDLAEAQSDLVVHGMALHWADDPVGQLIQCRRALAKDGLFLGVFLGGQTLTELRQCLATAESKVTGGLSPRVSPMPEIRDVGALLQRAGFALPVADSVTLTAEYGDIWHLMHDLRAMGETNALAARPRHPTRRKVFEAAAEIYDTHWRLSSGRIQARFELITLTGWAPAESQPQPLRPGSAQARLADALKTPEIKLPD